MFNKRTLIQRVTKLPFNKCDFWVVAGGAMVLHGFKRQTKDIDLGCTTLLADRLELQGYKISLCKDGTRKILYSNDTEIFENWFDDKIETIYGIPVVSVNGLIQMKRSLGRDKDLADIALIEQIQFNKIWHY